jgi:Uncharacterised protein family (UPF0236)
MQELMVYAGQFDCYARGNEVIKKFMNIEVSPAQVYRVTDLYGEELGKATATRTMPPVKQEELLYVEADGSMVLTRGDGWKEVKVGRLFKSGDCMKTDDLSAGKPGCIRHSQYLAHLGDSRQFTAQMDGVIESYGALGKRLVFISDGAPWIRNWIEDTFPGAESILDYYHASQHLYEFVNLHFQDIQSGKEWGKAQEKLMLESSISDVIKNIQGLGPVNKEAQKLMDYYTHNIKRMDYKRYRQIGCGIIGSGAIESAHRTVVQKRMKLSGQRWSKSGAQNMLNLRVTDMNEKWDRVIELVKTNFKQAA